MSRGLTTSHLTGAMHPYPTYADPQWNAAIADFRSRLTGHWPTRHSPAKYPDSYLTWWLGRIQRDAFGFAGCEIARRTIGLAKVSDLESLDDAGYAAAAETMLRLSRLLLVEQDSLTFEQLSRAAVPSQGRTSGHRRVVALVVETLTSICRPP